MLIPRMTIRQLLWAMAVLGGLCWVVALAAQGDVVGMGISLSIVALLFAFLVYALVYWTLYLVALLANRLRQGSSGVHPRTAWPVAGENDAPGGKG